MTSLRPSAASVLAQIGAALRSQGGLLLTSRLRGRRSLEAVLAEHCADIPRFDDNELAMEWYEEHVLEQAGLSPAARLNRSRCGNQIGRRIHELDATRRGESTNGVKRALDILAAQASPRPSKRR